MKTNFFESLAALKVEGDWQITVKAGSHNMMLVSVLFKNDKVSDDARKLLPPMLLKGTAEEMDEGFFAAIENPVKQTASLFTNMEAYSKAQEHAKEQSLIERDKEQQTKKEKESDNKKYDAQMKKVTDLQAAGKYREAYAQLPKPSDFPAQEEEINEKKEELMEKFETGSLFQKD